VWSQLVCRSAPAYAFLNRFPFALLKVLPHPQNYIVHSLTNINNTTS